MPARAAKKPTMMYSIQTILTGIDAGELRRGAVAADGGGVFAQDRLPLDDDQHDDHERSAT